MRRFCYLILLLATSLQAFAQAESARSKEREIRKYIESLERDSLFSTTTWSITVKNLSTGHVIASHNPTVNLTGASINKLLTTSVALAELGSDFKYGTTLAYKGEVKDSTLYGSLYIIGGGDPTLGSGYSKFFASADSTFTVWAKELKRAAIARIEGEIVADDRYFSREDAQDTWTWDDLSTYYGTVVRGLSFYENVFDISLSANKTGDPASISQLYPVYPFYKFDNRTVSGDTGGRSVTLYTYPFASDFQAVMGKVGRSAKSYKMSVANRMPGLSLGGEFYEFLTKQPLDTTKIKLRLVDSDSPEAEQNLTPIYTHYSPDLKQIAAVTNKYSDNMYAETIFRTLGKRFGKSDSSVDSRAALADLLGKRISGVNTIKIVDGSGLSSQNFLNTAFYTDMLFDIYNSDIKDDFIYTLAVPGSEGTFKNTISSVPTRKNLYLKSGTLTGVKGVVGYSITGEDDICFAIIVNKYHSYSAIAPKLDKLLEILSR